MRFNRLYSNEVDSPVRAQSMTTPESMHRTLTWVSVEVKHRPRNHFVSRYKATKSFSLGLGRKTTMDKDVLDKYSLTQKHSSMVGLVHYKYSFLEIISLLDYNHHQT